MNKVKFGELFEYKKKSKIKAGDGLKVNEGKYPFYTSSNTLSKSIDEFQFTKPSLIFGTGGMPSVHFCEDEFSVSTDCLVAQPKDVSKIYVPYSYYFFTQNDMRILQEGFKGAGLKHISRNYIDKIEIPLPPLKTQKHIAQILDDAAALRDKTKQLLTEYDLLAQAIFLDMFGDPFNNNKKFKKGTIRDLVLEAKYGTSSKASEVGEFCYLRMNNITYSGYMDYEKLKYVDIPKKDLSKYIVRKGDLLFNRTNSKELVGKTAIFDSNTEMIAAGYLIRVRLNEKGNPYFVWGYLNSKHGKLILNNMCKSIVGMANINAQELQNIKILLPPIELQDRFAEKIALIEQQKALAKQELQESEDLFNCLLQKAFKGELV